VPLLISSTPRATHYRNNTQSGAMAKFNDYKVVLYDLRAYRVSPVSVYTFTYFTGSISQ
jgi:hypothetical protein